MCKKPNFSFNVRLLLLHTLHITQRYISFFVQVEDFALTEIQINYIVFSRVGFICPNALVSKIINHLNTCLNGCCSNLVSVL